MDFVGFDEGQEHLDWLALCDALEAGHQLAKAEIGDTFLYRDKDTTLTRSAWIDGLGIAVKTATIFPDETPSVNGGFCLYSDANGTLDAVVDFHLVTKWKTAGDSLLAARKLARPDARNILIVGAGTVAGNLIEAYRAGFPDARFTIWNRNRNRAEKLAEGHSDIGVASDLQDAIQGADIISCATMSTEPLIKGEWLRAGQHVDLIGAYRPDMREADDVAIKRASLFVDSRDTTINHIGEIKIPIATGVIDASAIKADYYDLDSGSFTRRSDDEITMFKNGGGAHLDLMTGRYILNAWRAAQR